MSSHKFVDLFFHKKYIDWTDYIDRIKELELEYYGHEEEDRQHIAG